ncbi:hypothetical protein PAPYR_787 [Paratrimastix pyriformis]|uniref:RING-type E3 ubiquitin transferase n=1 Tax=Paratrimastix pyriformis TaxID=342808 RepID=A0ABQ8V111_9EUKA|nr:hypothetical protein PAPYR_787 [Paratrimastix pyriformis]
MIEGYPVEIFVDSVPPEFICTICQCVMRQATIFGCKEASHKACSSCCESWFSKSPSLEARRCPICRQNVAQPCRDLSIDAMISRMKTYCNRKAEGCEWVGTLESLAHHQRCDCSYRLLRCPNLGCAQKEIPARLMEQHVRTCPHRLERCAHCQQMLPLSEKDLGVSSCRIHATPLSFPLQAHVAECPRLPVACPQGCGSMVPRETIRAHQSDQCPRTVLPCPVAGCGEQMARSVLGEHLTAKAVDHILFLSKLLLASQADLAQTRHQVAELSAALAENTRSLEVMRRALPGGNPFAAPAKTATSANPFAEATATCAPPNPFAKTSCAACAAGPVATTPSPTCDDATVAPTPCFSDSAKSCGPACGSCGTTFSGGPCRSRSPCLPHSGSPGPTCRRAESPLPLGERLELQRSCSPARGNRSSTPLRSRPTRGPLMSFQNGFHPDGIEITAGGTVATLQHDRYGCINCLLSDEKLTHGRTEVAIHVLALMGREGNYIGVLCEPPTPEQLGLPFGSLDKAPGWGLHDSERNMGLFSQGHRTAVSSRGFGSGDMVRMRVDVDRGELDFWVNDVHCTHLKELAITRGVYPVIVFCKRRTSYQIVSSTYSTKPASKPATVALEPDDFSISFEAPAPPRPATSGDAPAPQSTPPPMPEPREHSTAIPPRGQQQSAAGAPPPVVQQAGPLFRPPAAPPPLPSESDQSQSGQWEEDAGSFGEDEVQTEHPDRPTPVGTPAPALPGQSRSPSPAPSPSPPSGAPAQLPASSSSLIASPSLTRLLASAASSRSPRQTTALPPPPPSSPPPPPPPPPAAANPAPIPQPQLPHAVAAASPFPALPPSLPPDSTLPAKEPPPPPVPAPVIPPVPAAMPAPPQPSRGAPALGLGGLAQEDEEPPPSARSGKSARSESSSRTGRTRSAQPSPRPLGGPAHPQLQVHPHASAITATTVTATPAKRLPSPQAERPLGYSHQPRAPRGPAGEPPAVTVSMDLGPPGPAVPQSAAHPAPITAPAPAPAPAALFITPHGGFALPPPGLARPSLKGAALLFKYAASSSGGPDNGGALAEPTPRSEAAPYLPQQPSPAGSGAAVLAPRRSGYGRAPRAGAAPPSSLAAAIIQSAAGAGTTWAALTQQLLGTPHPPPGGWPVASPLATPEPLPPAGLLSASSGALGATPLPPGNSTATPPAPALRSGPLQALMDTRRALAASPPSPPPEPEAPCLPEPQPQPQPQPQPADPLAPMSDDEDAASVVSDHPAGRPRDPLAPAPGTAAPEPPSAPGGRPTPSGDIAQPPGPDRDEGTGREGQGAAPADLDLSAAPSSYLGSPPPPVSARPAPAATSPPLSPGQRPSLPALPLDRLGSPRVPGQAEEAASQRSEASSLALSDRVRMAARGDPAPRPMLPAHAQSQSAAPSIDRQQQHRPPGQHQDGEPDDEEDVPLVELELPSTGAAPAPLPSPPKAEPPLADRVPTPPPPLSPGGLARAVAERLAEQLSAQDVRELLAGHMAKSEAAARQSADLLTAIAGELRAQGVELRAQGAELRALKAAGPPPQTAPVAAAATPVPRLPWPCAEAATQTDPAPQPPKRGCCCCCCIC